MSISVKTDIELIDPWQNEAGYIHHKLLCGMHREMQTRYGTGYPVWESKDGGADTITATNFPLPYQQSVLGYPTSNIGLNQSDNYFSAPTPDGRAVIVDYYYDLVRIFNIDGELLYEWSLPGGSFLKLCSVASSNDYLFLLYWDTWQGATGAEEYHLEQRWLEDGVEVVKEWESGVQTNLNWFQEMIGMQTDSDLVVPWEGLLSDVALDDLHSVLTDIFMAGNFTAGLLSDVLLDIKDTILTDILLDDYHSVLTDLDFFLAADEEGLLSDAYLDDYHAVFTDADLGYTALSGGIKTRIELVGQPGVSDGLLTDADFQSVDATGWKIHIKPGVRWNVSIKAHHYVIGDPYTQTAYGDTIIPPDLTPYAQVADIDAVGARHDQKEPGTANRYMSQAVMNHVIDWGATQRNTTLENQDQYDISGVSAMHRTLSNDGANVNGGALFYSQMPQSRVFSSPRLVASETRLFVIQEFYRGPINMRDEAYAIGDPLRRSSSSTIHQFDIATFDQKAGTARKKISMTCAYGAAASDENGLLLLDTFWNEVARGDGVTPDANGVYITPKSQSTLSDLWCKKEVDGLLLELDTLEIKADKVKLIPYDFLALPYYDLLDHVTPTWTEYEFQDAGFEKTSRYSQISALWEQLGTARVLTQGGVFIIAYCFFKDYLDPSPSNTTSSRTAIDDSRYRIAFVDDTLENSYQADVGRYGNLLAYKFDNSHFFVKTDVNLLPFGADYGCMTDAFLYNQEKDGVWTDVILEVAEAAFLTDVILEVPDGALMTDVPLAHRGYLETQILISNSAPATVPRLSLVDPGSGLAVEKYPDAVLPENAWNTSLLGIEESNLKGDHFGTYPFFWFHWIRREVEREVGAWYGYDWSVNDFANFSGTGEFITWEVKDETEFHLRQSYQRPAGAVHPAEPNIAADNPPWPAQLVTDADGNLFALNKITNNPYIIYHTYGLDYLIQDWETIERLLEVTWSDDPAHQVLCTADLLANPIQVSGKFMSHGPGGQLMKFDGGVNSWPTRMLELPYELRTTGDNEFMGHHSFGLDEFRQEILVVRYAGPIDWESLIQYSVANKRIRSEWKTDWPIEDQFTCAYDSGDFFIRFNNEFDWLSSDESTPGDPIGTEHDYDSDVYYLDITLELDENDLFQRDIMVYDYDLNEVRQIQEIDGLGTYDVIQHVVGRNGNFYILAQVRDPELFTGHDDHKSEWIPDEELDDKYRWWRDDQAAWTVYWYRDCYQPSQWKQQSAYRAIRVYEVTGSLAFNEAVLIQEIPRGQHQYSNILIQEVTDTHVWLNWDGIVPGQSGIYGMGVKRDGTGYVEIPELVAIYPKTDGSGEYELITYAGPSEDRYGVQWSQPRGADIPDDTSHTSWSGTPKYEWATNWYGPHYNEELQKQLYDSSGDPLPWGGYPLHTFGNTGTIQLYDHYQYMRILNESDLVLLRTEIAAYQRSKGIDENWQVSEGYPEERYWNAAAQPAYSQVYYKKIWLGVKTDVDLRSSVDLKAPRTWIRVTDGGPNVIL